MQRKSFELKDFKKLFKIEKYCFINLQYGNVTNEISQFNKKRKNKLIDITNLDKFNDLDNLSALITSLDLVITVSNINIDLFFRFSYYILLYVAIFSLIGIIVIKSFKKPAK